MIYDVGIVTMAYKLTNDLVDRFAKFIAEARPQCSCVIYVVDEWNCDPLTNGEFNRCIADNSGIIALQDNCKVIVCSDIDMLIPPGFIDITYRQALQGPVHSFARHIDPENITPRKWDEWVNIEYRRGSYGGWNAMTVQDWHKVGGWNEDLYGWGSDDVELHDRLVMKNMKAHSFTDYPVIHVTHPPRGTVHRNKENRQLWVNNVQRLSVNWLDTHAGEIERPQHRFIPIKTTRKSSAVLKSSKKTNVFDRIKTSKKPKTSEKPQREYVDNTMLMNNMNSSQPFASLVLVCYRRYASLIETLEHYLAFKIPLNVLLWINAFHEIPLNKRRDIQSLLSEFSNHKLVLSRYNVGTAKSRNELIQYAYDNFDTKYIATSDDDVQYRDKASFCVPATLLDQPEFAEYGSIGIHYRPWSPIAIVTNNELYAKKPTEQFHDTDVLGAATMFFRREIVGQGINVDPAYKIGWVDWDFSYAIRQAGYKLGLLCDSRYYAVNKATGDGIYKKNRYNSDLSERNIELFKKKFGVKIIPANER